ncbi:MAG: hypothetical protein ACOY4K_04335 [Pseudomonadota bacterium]
MRTVIAAVSAAFLFAAPAAAQVEVSTLAAPDYFSLGDRQGGMPADLWKGTSPELVRRVLPTVGRKPMSAAAGGLARRLLGAGVAGSEGAGRDPEVAAARIQALLRLGDWRAAWAAAERAPGVGANAALAEAVAEAALVAGEDDAACRVSDQLATGRGDLYWLRLRTYCQARAGQGEAASLTLALATEKARDPTFGRLAGALIAGAGDPGAASLRNGLDYALSRRLALDLEPAKATASTALAAALWPPAITPESEEVVVARSMVAAARQSAGLVDTLIGEAEAAPAKSRPALYGRMLLLAAMGAQLSPDGRAALALADAGRGAAAPALLMALDAAAAAGLKGETALLAVAAMADAGAAGPPAADRARIVLALRRAGLEAEAEALALEGLAAPVK